jgi:spore coat polysaccharide biosynthesis protein SpsF
MKTAAIVQARYASTRLPGKILKALPYDGSETALHQVIKRLRRCVMLDEVIIATTDHPEDDAVAALCEEAGVGCFRGSMDDVLSRYYGAANRYGVDVVVRVTSDCPCIDSDIIDDMLRKFENADYMSNVHPRIFPHGLDAEVFTFEALKKAHEEAEAKHEREHVTPYIINGGFRKISYQPSVCGGAEIRITLDRPEDYAALCAVYDSLYKENEFFGYAEIMRLFREKRWIGIINENVVQKKAYENINDEIDAGVSMLRLQELHRAADILDENR